MKNRTIPGFDLASLSIGGATYTRQEVPLVQSLRKRLLLSFTKVPCSGLEQQHMREREWVFLCERIRVFQSIFAVRFPHEPLPRESAELESVREWFFLLPHAREDHVSWARAAKDCGLIDGFTLDYGS